MRKKIVSIELRPRNTDLTISENRKKKYINMQHVSNCVASTSQASQALHEIYRSSIVPFSQYEMGSDLDRKVPNSEVAI